MPVASFITPSELRERITFGTDELALLDVSEEGQFGVGHLLWATNTPYSRLELVVRAFVSRLACAIVLVDQGDGIATLAARRLFALGYLDIAILQGGTPAWRDAGHALFHGIYVPSKAFGEWIADTSGTPTISASTLQRYVDDERDLVILDPRTVPEHAVRHVPGAIACPSAELMYRIHDLAPAPDTLVVIACGGRTRGIVGAQTLIDAQVPNKVVALEDGNHGWQLAGYTLEAGLRRAYGAVSERGARQGLASAQALAQRSRIPRIDAPHVTAWTSNGNLASRTTIVLDVRSPEEYRAGHLPEARSAPGGQLVQATDRWLGTLGSRVVLVDDDGVRAVQTAHWLKQMGWDVYTCVYDSSKDADIVETPRNTGSMSADAAARVELEMAQGIKFAPEVTPGVAQDWIDRGAVALVVDASTDFLEAHPPGAQWANRARLDELVPQLRHASAIVLISRDGRLAQLAATDLSEALPDVFNAGRLVVVQGGMIAWEQAGLPTTCGDTGTLRDADRIDYLFWAHDRRQGNRESMRIYLNWERQLLEQARLDHPAFPLFRACARESDADSDRHAPHTPASLLTVSAP